MFLDEFKGKFTPFKIKINEKPGNNLSFEIVDCPIKDYKIENLKIQGNGNSKKRIFFYLNDFDGKHLAFVSLYLTSNNEIINQSITYYGLNNLKMNHYIQQIRTTYENEYESFKFTKEMNGIEENLTITQIKGNIISVEYGYDDNRFSSSHQFNLFKQPECVIDYRYSPYTEIHVNKVSNYQAIKAKLKEVLNLDFNCSDEELNNSIKKYILDYNRSKGIEVEIMPNFETDSLSEYAFKNRLDLVLSYLANKKHNDLLQYFQGKYIGGIYYIEIEKYTTNHPNYFLTVVTEKEIKGNIYRCYTILEGEITNNENIIRAAQNGPKYVTILKNGEEELAFYNGNCVSNFDSKEKEQAKNDYDKFVNKYITYFSDIKPVVIEDFIEQGIDR